MSRKQRSESAEIQSRSQRKKNPHGGAKRNKAACSECGKRVRLRSKSNKWLIANHKDKRTNRRCDGVGKPVDPGFHREVTVDDHLPDGITFEFEVGP